MGDRLGIPIAWYKARIPKFSRKSIREGARSLFGRGPERPQNISCFRATPRLHRCKSGFALEQETFLGLAGPCLKRLLAPSLIDFWESPGIWALYQAIGTQGQTAGQHPKASLGPRQPLFVLPALRELESA